MVKLYTASVEARTVWRRNTEPESYPRAQYRRTVKEWRSRVLRLFWWGFLLALVLLAGAIAWMGKEPAFWVGFLTACTAMAPVMILLSPPAHVDQFEEGALGEDKTRKALSRLSDKGYIIRHSLPALRGDYDHVVAGPSGVYLIDSKLWSGRAVLDGDRVLVQRSGHAEDDDIYDLGGKIRSDASRLKEGIQELTGVRRWVQSVVVFWSPTDFEIEERNKTFYVRGPALAEWIASRPQKLTAPQYRAAIRWLNRQGIVAE